MAQFDPILNNAKLGVIALEIHVKLESTKVQNRILSQGNLFYFAKLQGKKWIGSSSKQ